MALATEVWFGITTYFFYLLVGILQQYLRITEPSNLKVVKKLDILTCVFIRHFII